MSDYAVINPATGETVAEYPTITDSELADAIAGAAAAQKEWARTPVAERAKVIARVAELHTERRDELAAIIVEEMGKPLEQALGEVDFCVAIHEYYAENGPEFLADEPVKLLEGEGSAIIRQAPFGVLLGIMPWNFPYYQVARFAGPNLVAGNAILLKHAPQCPKSATALQEIFDDAGLPAGVYTNIFATNDQIAEVIADPRVEAVSVTGSARAGAAVAEVAGRNLKKVVLELGGSDPFILLSTDDLDAAVEAGMAARLDNSGQACNAAKRFIVAEDLYDDFAAKFTEKFTAVTPGDPTSPETELGPLSSAAATQRLQEQVDRAVDQGAQISGDGRAQGNFFPPTVLTGVTPEQDAYTEEFFGPVAMLFKVSSEEEAVALANDTPYGLGSYVFTTDDAQALRVADALAAGMVFVNAVGAEGAELIFGGIKRSGFGRELGRYGIGEFVNRKLIRVVPA
ncbi:NAD-dependent succinate-semialdehyde dehydrogenase [Naumannella halotolerans]|uniref:Succinate-semialdehyde dehydrogenase/glutarate-semialdehyde dehydrogenase n=1 Tax=Naumannella halotolerans TaxID=993414 RepID=A0A4R7J8C4_9ACTN|nr:NAD-dependent succinate-semialdehyde dehydrogenase [Naumannella halotolerans]TDT32723.1 succinate-semialdehyde dehydrogenase/glutarate-semialdehyde dehydrogenase [Naumannella halotolerans]